MPRRSLPRRLVVAALGDALAIGLRLPGGVWVGLAVAVPLALVTVGAASLVRRGSRTVVGVD